MPTLFLTGATGYIGGAILAALLASPNASGYQISVLVRGNDRAAWFREMGVTPVVGGNDDSELLESVARESDVVIHTADSSDHLPSTESLLRGLSKRFEATGKAPLYLHTSGTGVLADKARGGALSSKIYSDDNESIDTLADTQPHRNVDLAVKKAGLGGKVRCHIVIPPIIYGISKGPFKRDTFFLAPGIRAAIKDGKAGYVGSGAPRWNTVHVDDLAEFYLLLLQKAGDERWGGYYFAETGNVSFKEIAEAAAKALGEKIGKSVPVASWTPEEAKKNCRGVGGVFIWGSNSRCRAVRAYNLGWKPRHVGKGDFMAAMRDQVSLLLREDAKL